MNVVYCITTDQGVYVGITVNFRQRMRTHKCHAFAERKGQWTNHNPLACAIRESLGLNSDAMIGTAAPSNVLNDFMKVEILQECDSADELRNVEPKWIAQKRRDGFRVLNLSDGGELTQTVSKPSPRSG